MHLTIHRGTNEIGGSCVELTTDTTRLLIDFGMPIVSSTGGDFDSSVLKNKSINELIELSILPNIDGLYHGNESVNAVLLSHSHIDHYGLLNHINEDIPVYLGKATADLIEINNIFVNGNIHIKNPQYFEKEKSFEIGNIKITSFWNDHSGFDAYSFLIEAEGKRVFYSGDFRSHGRKSEVYKRFIANAPKDIDYLILEGTAIGKEKSKTENDIQAELLEIFKESHQGCCVWTSSQNIDRLVSIYKACSEAKKVLAIDLYTANILHRLSQHARLPDPLRGFDNIKVSFSQHLVGDLLKSEQSDLVYPFTKFKVTMEELAESPEKYIMIIRPSLNRELGKMNWRGGKLVYSMWEGYKSKEYTANFLDYMTNRDFEVVDVHTSGHADETTLIEFANALNPKHIIPIHTFQKSLYSSLFSQDIIALDDNEMMSL